MKARPPQYYNLQVWRERYGKWQTIAHGPLEILETKENELILENLLHPAENTRIIRAGSKEYHFGEGNYDYNF